MIKLESLEMCETCLNYFNFTHDYQSTLEGNINCNAFIDKSIIFKPPFIIG